ncbi:MAG: endonuclease [Bacteroidales bacterium]|nr:endonuclease [Bacteroidales bacterium]
MTNRLKCTFISVMVLLAALSASADIPVGYYNAIDGKTTEELKSAIQSVIRNHTQLTYNSLWGHFRSTDMYPDGVYYWDMYSDIKRTSTGGMNREHSFPKSWWGGTQNEAYTDINHLYPSDGDANMKKSNYPLGIVNPAYTTFDNGVSKVGNPLAGYGGGSSVVFEPDDRYKGDFARTYFYMVTMYQDYTWKTNYAWMLEQDLYPTLKPWAYNMLLEWSRNDPVSQKEIDRNEAVYRIQKNRNPFIDFPGLEEYIWGNKKGKPFNANIGGETGDPVLVTPANGDVFDFDKVVVGQTGRLKINIAGQYLTKSLSVLIYGADAKLFTISGSSSGQSASINSSLINAAGGYLLEVLYTPTALGQSDASITFYDGGLPASAVVQLKAEAVPEPVLTAPIALEASNIEGTNYQANWQVPDGEEIDYYIVTRTIFRNGSKFTAEYIAEENFYQFDDLEAGTTQSYSVQSVRLGFRSPMSNTINVAPGGVEGTMHEVGLAVTAMGGALKFSCPESHTGIEVINLAGQVVMRVPQVDDGTVVEVPSGMYYVRSRQTRTPIPVIVR